MEALLYSMFLLVVVLAAVLDFMVRGLVVLAAQEQFQTGLALTPQRKVVVQGRAVMTVEAVALDQQDQLAGTIQIVAPVMELLEVVEEMVALE